MQRSNENGSLNPTQFFFLVAETHSSLYSEQEHLSAGVSTKTSCLVSCL